MGQKHITFYRNNDTRQTSNVSVDQTLYNIVDEKTKGNANKHIREVANELDSKKKKPISRILTEHLIFYVANRNLLNKLPYSINKIETPSKSNHKKTICTKKTSFIIEDTLFELIDIKTGDADKWLKETYRHCKKERNNNKTISAQIRGQALKLISR